MPVDWPYAEKSLNLRGTGRVRIRPEDAERQTQTAREILDDLTDRPGILLSDEVGMGKTYVALAVAASVILATRGRQGPVVVMVPSRLRGKWQREWEQFKRHCAVPGALDWIRHTYAHSPAAFFKLLDDDARHRKHLVFITTGCFSRGIGDPWIKLGMIRLARQRTKLSTRQKTRIYRWAADLVRLVSQRYLTEKVVKKLLNTDVLKWKKVLVDEWILDETDDDPIPELLPHYKDRIDWSPLVAVLREALPKRVSENIGQRMKNARALFNDACRAIYDQWLSVSKWHSPLLILDEAHHAKNDHTQLAQLFRSSSDDDVTLLNGKFQRMLFLTATPFQLGHQELIRVLRSFEAIRWSGARSPSSSLDDFRSEINQLESALDANRLAGRRLDRLWGSIRTEMLGDQTVDTWWRHIEREPGDVWEQRLVEAIQNCQETRDEAQKLLRPWVVRHNRPMVLRSEDENVEQPRRESICGRGILREGADPGHEELGLPIGSEAVLPFLLTARAQGELTQTSGARAFFAEGLASSYEAFHHTRDARGAARDMNDRGQPIGDDEDPEAPIQTIVPTAWYEERVASIIPSRSDPRLKRMQHPKIAATVGRVVDLWAAGEKVLVFCFYRETCKALYEHIREEIHAKTLAIAKDKLGAGYDGEEAVQSFLTRVARRFSEEGRPFHEEIRDILSVPLADRKYQVLQKYKARLLEVLAAYFRAPSFIARYLPLGDPDVQRAWELGEGRPQVLEPGLAALRRGIKEHRDRSNQTYLDRVYQFLDFAVELAERGEYRLALSKGEEDDEFADPLDMCIKTVSVYSRPRRLEQVDQDDLEDTSEEEDGSYRVVPLVRIVHGDTKPEARERLALAFNSPLFPEILVSSGVMGEGIDLHRFCRHVIHHDGYWNPSTLEQQTGRLDRIRCKAELCAVPIRVFQPYLAGSADEKMFRVVKDRERWVNIVMGQKFEFDENRSEQIAARVPIPESLGKELTFDLARWRLEQGDGDRHQD